MISCRMTRCNGSTVTPIDSALDTSSSCNAEMPRSFCPLYRSLFSKSLPLSLRKWTTLTNGIPECIKSDIENSASQTSLKEFSNESSSSISIPPTTVTQRTSQDSTNLCIYNDVPDIFRALNSSETVRSPNMEDEVPSHAIVNYSPLSSSPYCDLPRRSDDNCLCQESCLGHFPNSSELDALVQPQLDAPIPTETAMDSCHNVNTSVTNNESNLPIDTSKRPKEFFKAQPRNTSRHVTRIQLVINNTKFTIYKSKLSDEGQASTDDDWTVRAEGVDGRRHQLKKGKKRILLLIIFARVCLLCAVCSRVQ